MGSLLKRWAGPSVELHEGLDVSLYANATPMRAMALERPENWKISDIFKAHGPWDTPDLITFPRFSCVDECDSDVNIDVIISRRVLPLD